MQWDFIKTWDLETCAGVSSRPLHLQSDVMICGIPFPHDGCLYAHISIYVQMNTKKNVYIRIYLHAAVRICGISFLYLMHSLSTIIVLYFFSTTVFVPQGLPYTYAPLYIFVPPHTFAPPYIFVLSYTFVPPCTFAPPHSLALYNTFVPLYTFAPPFTFAPP